MRAYPPSSPDDSPSTAAFLRAALRKHNVAGTSIAVLDGARITTLCAGTAARGSPMAPDTWLQQASLSKTIAAAFMISYYRSKRIDPRQTPVVDVLERLGSPFKLECAPGVPGSFLRELMLSHLVNHTGLGLHYVPGVPPSRPGGFPPVLELLQGKHEAELRYPRILLEKRPGTKFAYSGAGFMLLQHILELEHGGKPIASILAPWLEECGIEAHDLGFDQVNPAKGAKEVVTVAHGYRENGSLVRDTRLMFPPLAAGAHGSPTALCRFLYHLARAYRMPPGAKSGPIPHETAKAMLDGAVDLGAFDFMHSRMGLGVFVTLVGPNRFMLHQAANDGFRGVFFVCFDGPDAGRGFVLLSNGDNNAMFMNCELCRALLKRMRVEGMDWSALRLGGEGGFDIAGLKQEEIVNLGIKQLVLEACIQPAQVKCRL
eukprot:g4151.t1